MPAFSESRYPDSYQQLPLSVVLVALPEVCLPVLSMFMTVQPVSLAWAALVVAVVEVFAVAVTV